MGQVCGSTAPSTQKRKPSKKDPLSDSILGQPQMHAQLEKTDDSLVQKNENPTSSGKDDKPAEKAEEVK